MCDFKFLCYNSSMKWVIIIKNVKINLKINDFFIETKGTLEESKLKFENDTVKYEFNFDNLTLIRENDEFLSIIDFNKENDNNFYLLKEINKEITNNLIIKELQLKKNIVIIRYEIEEEPFKLLLSYEED